MLWRQVNRQHRPQTTVLWTRRSSTRRRSPTKKRFESRKTTADTVPFQELISGALLGDLTAGYHLDGSPSELNRVKRWLRSTEVQRYAWPGNVRELQNALRNMLLGLEPALGSDLVRGGACLKEDGLPERVRDRVASLREVEDWYIAEVLDHLGHNYTQAAVALELDRATVRRRARSVAKTVGGSTR